MTGMLLSLQTSYWQFTWHPTIYLLQLHERGHP